MENSQKQYWFGSDSAGRGVEVATMDGKWFCHVYQFNGYGMAWTKWQPMDAPVIQDGNMVEWGFSRLKYAGINNRLRLPK